MAEQQGIFSYSGKLGNTVGYKRKDKYFERLKPKPYQPGAESLKSGAEFGKGSTSCALLKLAFAPLLLTAFSVDLHNRLSEKLRKIIRMGPVSKKGNRMLFDGDLSLLGKFEFNSKVRFSNLCSINVNAAVMAKEVKVEIPPFDWKDCIKAPRHAISVKIGLCCVFADFNKSEFTAVKADYLQIERGEKFIGGRFKIAVPDEQELAVLLMMNVFFESDLLHQSYVIEDKRYQAGIILKTVHLKDGEVVEFEAKGLPKQNKKIPVAPDALWALGWDEEEDCVL